MLRLLLLTLLCSGSTLGWTTSLTSHTKQQPVLSKLHASKNEVNDNVEKNSNRRNFLSSASMFVTTALVTGTMTSNPLSVQAADEDVDPFAEFDKIAQNIQGSSNYPNSISPLPTYKLTEKDLTADDSDVNTAPPNMEQALNDLKKKKTINPRTHG